MLYLDMLEPDAPVTGFGLEAIDFQPPGFYKLLSNIFQSIIDQTEATADGLITQKMIDDSSLIKIVRAQRGLFLKEIEVIDTQKQPGMSFNMFCTMVDFGSNHILNHSALERMKAYKASNLSKDALGKLYQESKGILKGGLDLKLAKLSGDFTRIPFNVGISDDFVKLFKQTAAGTKYQVKGEHLAFVFLHELGHAWDQFEYLVYDVRTNIVINAAICTLASEGDENKRRQILVDLENEINTPLPDKNELAQKNDGALYYISLQGRAQQERQSIYQAYGFDDINNENGADIFAARFGASRAGIEVISMFGREYADWQVQRRRGRLAGAVNATGIMSLLIGILGAATGSLAGFIAGGIVGGMMGSVIAVNHLIQTSNYMNNYLGGWYDDYYNRAERALRELYAQLKNPDLSREERALIQDDIENGRKALANIGKDNPLMKSFIQLFNAAARKELNIKQLQTQLETLVNNKLYSQANKFELLSGDS